METLNAIFVTPFLNLLIFLYSIIPPHALGGAVIAITILVRAVLWPFSAKALHSQKALKTIQPEVDKIRKKYKDKPQEMQKAMMELYKAKEVNPLSSCLPTLIQLPILMGLYWVFINFKDPAFLKIAETPGSFLNDIYPFLKNFSPMKAVIQADGSLNTTLFGLVDLAKPSVVLAVLAGATQFIQTKMMTPNKPTDTTQQMMSKMIYLFPIITIVISINLPAALPLYWTVSTAIAAYQQWLIMHKEVGILEHLRLRKKND